MLAVAEAEITDGSDSTTLISLRDTALFPEVRASVDPLTRSVLVDLHSCRFPLPAR